MTASERATSASDARYRSSGATANPRTRSETGQVGQMIRVAIATAKVTPRVDKPSAGRGERAGFSNFIEQAGPHLLTPMSKGTPLC